MCMKKTFICILTCIMMLMTSVGAYAAEIVPASTNNNAIEENETSTEDTPTDDPADAVNAHIANLKIAENYAAAGFDLTWEKVSDKTFDGYIIRIPGMEDNYVNDGNAVSAKIAGVKKGVLHEIHVIPFIWEETVIEQPSIEDEPVSDTDTAELTEETAAVSEPGEETAVAEVSETTDEVSETTNTEEAIETEVVRSAIEEEPLVGWGMLLSKPSLTAKAGDAKVTLSWGKVTGATHYEIIDKTSGKIIASNLKTTSYVVKGLKNSKSYKYQVRAAADLEKVQTVSEWSNTAAATTKITGIGKIKKLTVKRYNKGATLTWSAVSGATKYYVYRYDSKTKKWSHIKTTTSTQYKNSGLVVGRTYKYVVKPLKVSGGVTATGANSPYVTVVGKAFHTKVNPLMYKIYIWKKGNLYTSYSNAKKGKKCGTIKAGKTAVLIDRKLGFSKIKYNGKYYWFSNFKFNYRSCVYDSKKDYTTETKENYVNSKKYSSKTKYLIWINGYTQRVNIFKGSKGKWDLIKTYKCGTGTAKARTQSGIYKVRHKEKGWFYSTHCCRYVTHFAGRTSFHTRPQKTNGRLVDSTIGRPVSSGCIRMTNEGAKYIYKNIPRGTTVVSN